MTVISVDGQTRSSLVIDPPDGKVPPMKPEAKKRNAAFAAGGAVSPDANEGAAAGPPGAFDGPELRPLAERCLLGFGSTSGPPTLPNYFYNNMKQIVQTKDIDPDPERDGARRPRHPHERASTCRRTSAGGWAIRSASGKATRWSSTRPTSPARPSSAARAKTCTSSSASRAPGRRRSSTGSRSTIRRRGIASWTGEYPWNATRREPLRIRVPRRQLLARRDAARRAAEGRAEDAAKKSR